MRARKKIALIEAMGRLFDTAPRMQLNHDERYVIFSDLHIGDGRSNDDFRKNAELFKFALRDYYLAGKYNLILNGDIEELQRYNLQKIRDRWRDIYALFDTFHTTGNLFKIYGNHDYQLFITPRHALRYPLLPALRLESGDNTIFIYHGHQASFYYENFNDLIAFLLKAFANPLKIKNYSVAHDKKKKFAIERRAYEFASTNGILSMIGHTHRPLFESLSKQDYLKFHIERLCRDYPAAPPDRKREIETIIRENKREVERCNLEEIEESGISTLYSAEIFVPCLFNSGCVIGKRGMTALEIEGNHVRLVHWFDKSRYKQYVRENDSDIFHLQGTTYHRLVIKQDSLDYIFSRIKLLK
jgi:predicted phosphodiesterase